MVFDVRGNRLVSRRTRCPSGYKPSELTHDSMRPGSAIPHENRLAKNGARWRRAASKPVADAEPTATLKKEQQSLVVDRAHPSTMLVGTDNAARRICMRIPNHSSFREIICFSIDSQCQCVSVAEDTQAPVVSTHALNPATTTPPNPKTKDQRPKTKDQRPRDAPTDFPSPPTNAETDSAPECREGTLRRRTRRCRAFVPIVRSTILT